MANNQENSRKKKKHHNFNANQIEKALEVRKGMSCRKAAAMFDVSKSTLNRHINFKNTGKVGRPCLCL